MVFTTVDRTTGSSARLTTRYKVSVQNKIFLKFYFRQKLLGNCARCGETLEGNILKVEGAKYHSACFTCKSCSASLRDVSVLRDDQREIYCQSCHEK